MSEFVPPAICRGLVRGRRVGGSGSFALRAVSHSPGGSCLPVLIGGQPTDLPNLLAGLGLNIGHFQGLSSRRSSFRAERCVPLVSIKQLDSVASGNFLTGTCSVDPESRWPNLEPSPWFLFRPCPHLLVPTLRVGMHTRTLCVRILRRYGRNKDQAPPCRFHSREKRRGSLENGGLDFVQDWQAVEFEKFRSSEKARVSTHPRSAPRS